MAVTTYTVTARRSRSWWALEVPDLPGVYSQVKRLDQAEGEARDAIAVMLDIEPDDVDVNVEADIPEAAQDALAKVREAQAARERATELERIAMRCAAETLTQDLSQRDAGQLLGVSFQRISQLLGVAPAAKGKRTTRGSGTSKKGRAGSTESTKKAARGRRQKAPTRRSRESVNG